MTSPIPPPPDPLPPPPPNDPLNPSPQLPLLPDGQATFLRRRSWAGIGVGTAGFAVVVHTGLQAFDRFAHEDLSRLKASRELAWMFGVKVLAEAIVSVALVYFGYQLLKVAERMLLPHWWASKDNIDVARAMLGIDSPVDGVGKAAQSFADTAKSLRTILQKKSPEDD